MELQFDLEGSCKLLLQIEVFDRDGNVKPAVIPLDVMVGENDIPNYLCLQVDSAGLGRDV